MGSTCMYILRGGLLLVLALTCTYSGVGSLCTYLAVGSYMYIYVHTRGGLLLIPTVMLSDPILVGFVSGLPFKIMYMYRYEPTPDFVHVCKSPLLSMYMYRCEPIPEYMYAYVRAHCYATRLVASLPSQQL